MDWLTIWEYVQFFAARVWQILSAPLAQRLYVVAIGTAAIVFALIRARGQKGFLEEISADYFDVGFPGRQPTLPKSIRKRLERIRQERGKRTRAVWLSIGELVALGVVLPALLLALGTFFYAWFDPSVAALLEDRSGSPIASPTPWQIAVYVSDHLLRGGLFDLMEVFKLHASNVTNNRHAYGYTVGLFLFHLYVEGFFLVVLITLAKMAFLMPRALRPAKL